MERALAVVEATEETKELVRLAGKLAAGVDAELYLLSVMTDGEFQERQSALASVDGFDTDYSISSAATATEQFAKNIGREVLEDDVEVTALGRIGDRQTKIMDVADEHEIDHIFIHGKQRSPTGKAVFGDLAQSIILNFDGAVTVTTGENTD